MAAEDLQDELDAVNAIFPNCSYKLGPQIYGFRVPQHEDVQVELTFPESYPDEPPSVLQVLSKNMRYYSDTQYLERTFASKLKEVYMGEVCMYEFLALIEEMMNEIEEEKKKEEEQDIKRKQEQNAQKQKKVQPTAAEAEVIRHPAQNPLEGWSASDPIVDRGSTFIGYCRKVKSVAEAEEYLSILTADKKISKASHNMVAWRIKGENGIQYQDCDDDGETAAGGRMLHLLTVRIYWLAAHFLLTRR